MQRPDSSNCSSHSHNMPASPPSSVAEQATAAGPVTAPQPTNPVLDHSLSGAKRKEMEPERKRPGFKVVGQMVLAMKRFSNAINPTYSYGGHKRPSSSTASGSKGASDEKEGFEPVSSARPKSPGHAEGEGGKYAYQDHGHKFAFLLKPLPPTEEEEGAQQAPGASTASG